MRGEFVALGGALALLAVPASAHIALKQKEAPADSDYTATFVVEHGCSGSPTVRLRMRIAHVLSKVKVFDNGDWKGSAARESAEPDARVIEIVWVGGKLDSRQEGEFVATMRLPDMPGVILYFPVVQECEEGMNRWLEVPGPDRPASELRLPAPALRLLPKDR
jgi:uncharacterized protein YcnI